MTNGIPPVEPITEESLSDFCVFLSRNLNSSKSPEEWQAGFRVPWDCRRPNYGYLLRDSNGHIVGGLGAIYSRQLIGDKEHDFCNLTSWCVQEAYRSQSMRLALKLTEQVGFELTNFSPTKVVARVLRFLDFRELDERISYIPNLPFPGAIFGRSKIEWNAGIIERSLAGDLLRVYRDHSLYPWLKFALLEADRKQSLIILKSTWVKGVSGAKILYLSDRDLYAKHLRTVSACLLFKHGYSFTQIETRFLLRTPFIVKHVSGYAKKLFLSRTLSAEAIDYIYSESVCLDL
jgi:hypothetical protein